MTVSAGCSGHTAAALRQLNAVRCTFDSPCAVGTAQRSAGCITEPLAPRAFWHCWRSSSTTTGNRTVCLAADDGFVLCATQLTGSLYQRHLGGYQHHRDQGQHQEDTCRGHLGPR
jgi:hypothetical protein